MTAPLEGESALGRQAEATWIRILLAPARVARSLFEEFGWWLLGALAAAAMALAYWEFTRSAPGLPVLDRIQRGLKLFTLDSGAVVEGPSVRLEAARWMAFSVAIVAPLRALTVIFRDRWAEARARLFSRNHVLVCGLGRCGGRLALRLREAGYRVVGIEANTANPAIEICRKAGVVVLVGNCRDPLLLRRAGIVRRARYLIAACGDDHRNLGLTFEAHNEVPLARRRPLECFVHITDPTVTQFLRRVAVKTKKARVFRLTPFDLAERGATRLLAQYPPFEGSGLSNGEPPHILVVGLGQMGTRVIVDAAARWVEIRGDDTQRLPVTVVDLRAEERAKDLESQFPRVRLVCDLKPVSLDVEGPEFRRGEFLRTPATRVYVCLDEDLRALRAGLALEEGLRGSSPIVVRTGEQTGVSEPPDRLDAHLAGRLQVFRMIDEACTPDILRSSWVEVLAEAIHSEYVARRTAQGDTPETNTSLVPWDELPESLKESSRSQASHVEEKLRSVGRDIRRLDEAVTPDAHLSLDEIEALARMEHQRWVDERVAAGWTYGPRKDVVRKETPFVIPWEDLSEEQRENDRHFIRELPRLLEDIGFVIVREDARVPREAVASTS